MPDLIGVLRQFDPFEFLLAFVVEEADLYLGRVGGEESEIRALSIPRSTSWVGKAFFDAGCAFCGHDDVSFRYFFAVALAGRDARVFHRPGGLVEVRPTASAAAKSMFTPGTDSSRSQI